MKNQQGGWTLIEMVIVLIIVGILAAIAAPRFIDAVVAARIASLKMLAGTLQSAVTLTMAEYRLEGKSETSTSTNVSMEGVNVKVVAGSGIPQATPNGIRKALRAVHGFVLTYQVGKVTFNLDPAVSNCKVVYKQNQGETIIYTGGC